MKKIIIVALILAAQPVQAAKCPYGQILRVKMGQCVSWHSKLAYAYVGRPVHVSLRRLIIEAAPVATPVSVPVAIPAPAPKPPDPANSDTVRMMKAVTIPTSDIK